MASRAGWRKDHKRPFRVMKALLMVIHIYKTVKINQSECLILFQFKQKSQDVDKVSTEIIMDEEIQSEKFINKYFLL